MNAIHTEFVKKVRSFVLVLYDGSKQQKEAFALPTSIAAPFCNRLFREVFAESKDQPTEPWYTLRPHCAHEAPLRRTSIPEGPTSLRGQRYVPEDEEPPRVTLHPDAHIRYFTVRLLDYQSLTHQGEYGVDDLFLAAAEFLARSWIAKGFMAADEGPFYYTVETSADAVTSAPKDLFPADAYAVEGVFHLPEPTADRERTVFRRVKDAPLRVRDASSFGETQVLRKGDVGSGKIFIRANVYRALKDQIVLSDTVENGGYLLGVPFRDADSPEDEQEGSFRWSIEITDVVQAENAYGQQALLLFTGETWSQVSRKLASDYPDKKLVAWFHTHLFEATDSFGLSGLDQDLHRRFLTKPWQVAVLLNINADGERTVRCFQRGPDGNLVECAFHVFDLQDGKGVDRSSE